MALTLEISTLLYKLHNQAVNQAEDGNLTDAMAAKIIRTIRELGINFEGRKTEDYGWGGQVQDRRSHES